ncbi:hypothetical protein J3F84DRAFT_289753 [Trichoderma pleuroticola]
MFLATTHSLFTTRGCSIGLGSSAPCCRARCLWSEGSICCLSACTRTSLRPAAVLLCCRILGINSRQGLLRLLAGILARPFSPSYRSGCYECPAAWSGGQFPSARSCCSTCHAHSLCSTLAHKSCSLLRLQPCIPNHTPSPLAPLIKLCRLSSVLLSAPAHEGVDFAHHARQTERSSGSHRSGCFESPAHQFSLDCHMPWPDLIPSPSSAITSSPAALLHSSTLSPNSYFFASSRLFIISSLCPSLPSLIKPADVAFWATNCISGQGVRALPSFLVHTTLTYSRSSQHRSLLEELDLVAWGLLSVLW